MIGTEEIKKEILFKQFFKFYDDIKKIRDDCKASPCNLQEIQEASLKILDNYALSLSKYRDEFGDDTVDEMFYLITVFADEVFIGVKWEKGLKWEDYLLEEKIFKSHIAGIKIFENITKIIENGKGGVPSISSIYLLSLIFGFKGKYMHGDSEGKVNGFKEKLYSLIYKSGKNFFEKLHYLFPENYTHKFTTGLQLLMPNFKLWIFIGIFTTLFITFVIVEIFYPLTAIKTITNFYKFIVSHKIEFFLFLLFLSLALFIYTVWHYIRKNKLLSFFKKKFSKYEIRESFKNLIDTIRNVMYSDEYNTKHPWYIILGTPGSGKTSLMRGLSIREVTDNQVGEGFFEYSPCNFWIFDSGIIMDISGKLEKHENKTVLRNYIFKMFKRYRPRRPLDGVIITLSYQDLESHSQKDLLNSIKYKGDIIFEQLESLLNYTKMKLPVYILVTKCDKMEGFNEFVNLIPSRFKQSIFGWSINQSGYKYAFSKNWVNDAFKKINAQLASLEIGMAVNQHSVTTNEKIFQLSRNIDSLKYPLQIFANRVFRSSQESHLYTPFFRGIYFCGSVTEEMHEFDTTEKLFVKDLFEKKIFKEAHLAVPVIKYHL